MLAIQAFLSAFFSFLIFSAGIHAAPISNVEAGNIPVRSGSAAKVVVPTLAQMRTKLDVRPNTSLFYSSDLDGKGTCDQAKAWAAKHPGKNYKVLEQLWKDPNYPHPFEKSDPAIRKEFFDVASKAMAELSEGTVHVVLCPWDGSKTKDWYKESVWNRMEWPTLQDNKKVKTVIRVNPDNDAEVKILGNK
ncbi:hypothetical protein D9613_009532 [Agrocybe pediades]|uniref:Uncharacterized protein n=1 Tax=Agrocybe pediades TaxID=84607 RepID=A0A8H4VTE9_9AGAR|nr:hypothetical protein D9613_009532 [Agrocybe pediades]